MNTIDYLNQLRMIDKEILSVHSEAEKWLELSKSMGGANFDNIRVGGTPKNHMEEMIIKAADCALKADREREELINLKETMEQQIKSMPNKVHYMILWGYFHDNKNLTELSQYANYSIKQTRRLRDKAMKIFEEMYGDTYK